MKACQEFRAALLLALEGRAVHERLGALSWHEHLLACEGCKRLLREEEALEVLLATLPEPELAPDLVERLLTRLRPSAATASLDALLELGPEPDVPAGLGSRVLAAVHEEEAREEAALDRLLEGQPAPRVPVGLSARILGATREAPAEAVAIAPVPAGVPAEAAPKAAPKAAPGALLSRRSWQALPLAAAALFAVSLGLFWLRRDGGGAPLGDPPAAQEPSEEMLASLEVLENWDLLVADDLDLLLASFDPSDEILLDLEDDLDEGDRGPSDEKGSDASQG